MRDTPTKVWIVTDCNNGNVPSLNFWTKEIYPLQYNFMQPFCQKVYSRVLCQLLPASGEDTDTMKAEVEICV